MKNQGTVTKKLVVFFGLIASGKSFIAKAWAQKHGFPYCNTDVVRKQLAGIKPCDPRPEALSQGIYRKGISFVRADKLLNSAIYSPVFTRLTYDALVNFAEKALEDPAVYCVVLDGSYQAQAERERLRLRIECRARVIFVMCSCKEETIKARLAQRALDPAAVSDGNWEIYLRQKEVFEYPEELSVEQFRRLDTDKAVNLLLTNLDRTLENEVSDQD